MSDPRPPEELTVAAREGVAWLTLNRPQKANALNLTLLQALEKTLQDCAADASTRAIVLTGAGERAFCAGADLSKPAENPEAYLAQRRAQVAAVLFRLVDFPKPAFAAVNGAACGAGMMIALLCDAIVAADSARFSLPEINVGLPALPGAAIVSRRFDNAFATDLVQSGRFVMTDEALRRGMVAAVVPAPELAVRAQSLALDRAKSDGRAYAANKRWLNRDLRADLAAAAEASAQHHRH